MKQLTTDEIILLLTISEYGEEEKIDSAREIASLCELSSLKTLKRCGLVDTPPKHVEQELASITAKGHTTVRQIKRSFIY